jgi:hypothetical protein
MKRLLIIMILFIITVASGQEKKDPALDKKEEKKAREEKIITSIPNGYENITWGMILAEAKDKIKGKLVFTDDKKIIISNDGDLEYDYGFFYIDPAIEAAFKAKKEADKDKKETGKSEADTTAPQPVKADEGKLFYVSLKFPYLAMEDVRKKIEARYGASTNENLNNMQGALAWNGTTTIIIMWVDRYENRPYCRRITYVDKRITKELSDYQYSVFNRAELALLRQLGL